jgi:hypothetical protein
MLNYWGYLAYALTHLLQRSVILVFSKSPNILFFSLLTSILINDWYRILAESAFHRFSLKRIFYKNRHQPFIRIAKCAQIARNDKRLEKFDVKRSMFNVKRSTKSAILNYSFFIIYHTKFTKCFTTEASELHIIVSFVVK